MANKCQKCQETHKRKSQVNQKIMDSKLAASKQKYEIDYIAKKFSITSKEVKAIMKKLGKNGKLCRSRKMIYQAIREAVKS